jgi:hypothetical protein
LSKYLYEIDRRYQQAIKGGAAPRNPEQPKVCCEFLIQNPAMKGFNMSKKRLKSLADARRYLANLINRLEAGQVEPATAAKLGYLANILISCIKDSELESRIEALEKEMEGGEKQ